MNESCQPYGPHAEVLEAVTIEGARHESHELQKPHQGCTKCVHRIHMLTVIEALSTDHLHISVGDRQIVMAVILFLEAHARSL